MPCGGVPGCGVPVVPPCWGGAPAAAMPGGPPANEALVDLLPEAIADAPKAIAASAAMPAAALTIGCVIGDLLVEFMRERSRPALGGGRERAERWLRARGCSPRNVWRNAPATAPQRVGPRVASNEARHQSLGGPGMTRLVGKLSYANVVSSICLFIVLGGS